MSQELYNNYTRCFSAPSGKEVLKHLRKITIERFLGPLASEAELRTLEAERALVHKIESLIKRGK